MTLIERLRDFRTLSGDWKIMKETCEEAARKIEELETFIHDTSMEALYDDFMAGELDDDYVSKWE